MPAGADVQVEINKWAEPLFYPAAWKSAQGGRGSGKSHAFAQVAVLRMAGLLPDYPPGPVRIVSARDFKQRLDLSAKPTVEGYITRIGLDDEFDVLADRIRHVNGSLMVFVGVERSVGGFLSMEDVDVVWFEQAESLTAEQWAVIGPSIRKPGAERWFSWNPHSRAAFIWQRIVVNPQPGDVAVEANWRDNHWWGEDPEREKQRRYDELYNPEIYAWQWEGKPNDAGLGNVVLPYATLRACVDAFAEGLAPNLAGRRLTWAGLDIAEGGKDKCALVVRHGPTILLARTWPGVRGDLSAAAAQAKTLCEPWPNLQRLFYDAASPMDTDLWRAGFGSYRGVRFGGKVAGPDKFYEPRLRNKDKFASRNIQMADALRLRVMNTLRLVTGDKDISPEKCLFIDPAGVPQVEAFLTELSQPTRRFNTARGLWELEKAAAGERSPDLFDATCLAFAHDSATGLRAR